MKQRTFPSFMGIGAISLAIVLIILILTCFAVLTFISADSEYKLSQKGAESATQYYQADAIANEALCTIFSEKTEKKAQDILKQKGYNVTILNNREQIILRVPLNKKKELRVKALRSTTSSPVKILEWTVAPAAEQKEILK